MLLTPQELNHAFSLISFTSEQRRAVESVSRRINQEPVLERLAQRDAACLADPRGPERLEADKGSASRPAGRSGRCVSGGHPSYAGILARGGICPAGNQRNAAEGRFERYSPLDVQF